MTNEEKQLLLKDLCARLSYGVKGLHRGDVHELFTIDSREANNACIQVDGYDAWFSVDTFKPYLRSMSSMTDEERMFFHQNSTTVPVLVDTYRVIYKRFYAYRTSLIDWLLRNHFDWLGLIEKGLALEAPEGMYKDN